MMFIEDGRTPVWQDHLDHPPLEYKHLERDRFEELLDLMIAAYPDHPLTEWLKRGFAGVVIVLSVVLSVGSERVISVVFVNCLAG